MKDHSKVYATGRVYKLFSHINDYYYIGSTVDRLTKRKSNHISHVRQGLNPLRPLTKWINDVGFQNVKIKQIEEHSDINISNLRQKEDACILRVKGDGLCLNAQRAYLTEEDLKKQLKEQHHRYYEENKEKCLAQQKIYAEAHKDKKREYKKSWDEANKEKMREYWRSYRKTNKNKISQYQSDYKAKRKDGQQSSSSDTDEDRPDQLSQSGSEA